MPVIISFCVSVGGTRPPLDTCHLFWDPAPPLREALASFSAIFRVLGGFLGMSLASVPSFVAHFDALFGNLFGSVSGPLTTRQCHPERPSRVTLSRVGLGRVTPGF